MHRFLAIWIGQTISQIGTAISQFAIALWVYERTRSVMALALATLSIALPGLLLAPLAGPIVDRFNRKHAMLIGDSASAIFTALTAALAISNVLPIEGVYVLLALVSAAMAFQQPAWSACVPQLVDKKDLGRAAGLSQLSEAASVLLGPPIASVVLVSQGLGAIFVIDLVTFIVAVATLARTPVPDLVERTRRTSLLFEARDGARYVFEHRGLLGLLGVFAAINLLLGSVQVLYMPLLLSFTTEKIAGICVSGLGLGMIVGAGAAGATGGPRARVRGILVSIVVIGAALMGIGLRPWALLAGIAGMMMMAAIAVANASSQALWQTKVPLEMQGRVFSLRRMLALFVLPIAYLGAGPLADRVFEPLLEGDGALRATVGSVLGVGPGRGIAFFFVCMGAGAIALAIVAGSLPKLRRLEQELPDADPRIIPLAATPGGST
jgi:MFS family permease